jgi:hypothetical protein
MRTWWSIAIGHLREDLVVVAQPYGRHVARSSAIEYRLG